MKLLLVFFFKYLLAPIMAAIMLALMGSLKSVRQKLSMKKVIIFSLLAGLCLGLPSLFGFLRKEFVWGGLILSVIIYLGLGILFLQVVKSKFIKVNDERSPILEILLIITSSIIGMWVYYLVFDWTSNGLPYTIWAMLNLLWFTVPYFVDRSFLLFRKIQPPIYELWKTPDSVFNRNYWDTIDNFNTKSVKVRIKRKAVYRRPEQTLSFRSDRHPYGHTRERLDFLCQQMVRISALYTGAGPTSYGNG